MKSSPLALVCMLLAAASGVNADSDTSFNLNKIKEGIEDAQAATESATESSLDQWTSDDMRTAPSLHYVIDEDGNACRTVSSLTETVLPDDAKDSKPPYKLVCNGSGGSARRRHLEFMTKVKAASEYGIVLTAPLAGTLEYQPMTTFTGQVTGYDAGTTPTFMLTTDAGIAYEDAIDAEIDGEGYFTENVALDRDTTYTWSVKATIGGVETTSDPIEFRLESADQITTRSAAGGGGAVAQSEWTFGGADNSVGRLYFRMPDSNDPTKLLGYTCTGTVIHDNKSGRSLILTAAHCLYDEVNHAFATQVLFVPNEKDNGASSWDNTCSDDPCGCWEVSGAVIQKEWNTLGPFPSNHQYDYGFFIVKDDATRHKGAVCNDSSFLDTAVPDLEVDPAFDPTGDFIYSVGYSSGSVGIRYCSESVITKKLAGTPSLFIPNCDLLDGASGGPWLANVNTLTGTGTIVGVNSWGYVSKSGMGGPIIEPSAMRCLANAARETDIATLDGAPSGQEGVFASCFDRDCIGQATGRRVLRGATKCRH